MKNLVIVESPAKAKTIEKYLGKDFHVLSSVGHIRSIVKKTKDGTPPIDVANDFFAIYEVDPEKKKVITELKRNVKAVGKENVWLATDEDREAMVALELKPSLELASCCRVEVVNGAAGLRVPGVFEISLTMNSASCY
jgi:DNA topoisomerase IA